MCPSTCPSTYHCIASTIDSTFLCFAFVRPRLLTMVSASCNKQRVSACTCLVRGSLSSPERLVYASHCAFQAEKSVPRLTWWLSLGRSPCQKTYTILFWFRLPHMITRQCWCMHVYMIIYTGITMCVSVYMAQQHVIHWFPTYYIKVDTCCTAT